MLKVIAALLKLVSSTRLISLLFKSSESLIASTRVLKSGSLWLYSRQAYSVRGLCKIAILLSPSIMTGCVVSQPVWLGDSGVAELCIESGTSNFTHNGVTRSFKVNLVDDSGILENCGHDRSGVPAVACIISSFDIYVQPGVLCAKHMAHELNHGFGLHYVDRPRVGRYSFSG